MANWVLIGLRAGIRTSPYRRRTDTAAGVSPGRPVGDRFQSGAQADALVARCPARAIVRHDREIAIDQGRCVHCFRCVADADADGQGTRWEAGYEWAACSDEAAVAQEKLDRAFGRSLHVRIVDAGACSACMSEARQLNNPYYNMHNLGFFATPTPRNADVLLVAGPVTDAMRLPLRKAYDAMPTPKRVVAIGACAISGGVFGPSFISAGGAADVVPVDVVVPGCPPPPLAILHGLLVVVERKPPAKRMTDADASGGAAR